MVRLILDGKEISASDVELPKAVLELIAHIVEN